MLETDFEGFLWGQGGLGRWVSNNEDAVGKWGIKTHQTDVKKKKREPRGWNGGGILGGNGFHRPISYGKKKMKAGERKGQLVGAFWCLEN